MQEQEERAELPPRLRAVCDLSVAEARAYGGRHEYDGQVQDLSPAGVRAGLARLDAARAGNDGPAAEPHDAANLGALETAARVRLAGPELNRWNPSRHLGGLDLSD